MPKTSIEILLSKLYARFGITDATDYSTKKPTDFPIMEDFYKLCEEEFYSYDKQRKYLYTEDTLQDVCLGIHSMCVGAESTYFNGHTNITDSHLLVFGVKGLMDTNKRLKDAMLFNILSFMSNQLLGQGKTAASIDELYLFLTNMTAIEYIRNAMKRVRKKDSSIILASQNIEDFLIPSIREFTKPLFSIPTHQFLFNAGQINPKEYMDALQVEPSEFELIKYPERGTCLFRCGNERYLLQVIAPDYHFGEGITDANENGKLLEEELRQREEINELIMTEDAIEMTYHLEHCPNCQQGGIAGALNLISLVGCNIYDEHDETPAEDLTEDDQTQVLSM